MLIKVLYDYSLHSIYILPVYNQMENMAIAIDNSQMMHEHKFFLPRVSVCSLLCQIIKIVAFHRTVRQFQGLQLPQTWDNFGQMSIKGSKVP